MTSLWSKAIENADAARLLLTHHLYNNACTRAYYAMFTAARSLLEEQKGVPREAMKRHASVIQLFSLHFVKNGPLNDADGAVLSRASRLRRL